VTALEAVWHGPPPDAAPTLVFLHEGLGSVSAWRDFPRALADATGCGALAYSRAGYGASPPTALPRAVSYMHDEAKSLPGLLHAHGVARPILVGHSDGASIALIAVGSGAVDAHALVLEAPHVFVEDVSVEGIAAAKRAFEAGELRARLARHHADVDDAFRGWNDVWLSPAFRAWNIERELAGVRCPTLVVQGDRDPYGTMAQVDAIERGVAGPFERVILPGVGHAPHKDALDATLAAMTRFVRAAIA
jgi:pimeloyl-ACP methyl ester carboxylesterase